MSAIGTRRELFKELSEHRGRDLITLVTSTKKPENIFSAQIAGDVIPVIYDILKGSPNGGKLDILLYTAGGHIDAPWPIVNLIREYYSDVYTIVPFNALSAGTLITLGSDMIGMSPMAALSPVDPQLQVKHEGSKEVIGAGVEDIYGYYDLLKDILNLDDAGRTEGLKLLSARIHPEILGKCARIRKEIRIVATNLLQLHMKEEENITYIVNQLIEELPSHQYIINRAEAKRIGLPVENLDKKTEDLASQIIESYFEEMGMKELGLEINFDASEETKVITMRRAYVETKDKSFAFITRYTFHKDGKVDQSINQYMEVNT